MLEERPNLLFVRIENSNRSHLDDAGFRAVRDRIEGLAGDLIAEATRPASAREGRHG